MYHDNFKECDELFKAYQAQLGDMRLLGIMTDAEGNLRCEKDGVIHWVNEKELTKQQS